MIDTKRGIIMFLLGSKHACVAAVSVWSLIRHYNGPILFLVGDNEGAKYAEKIANSVGTRAEVKMFPIPAQRRNTGYAAKPRIPALSPFRFTIQLDADTVVTGPLGELWPSHDQETVLTQFAHWTTAGNIISSRVKWWQTISEPPVPKLVRYSLEHELPAINTGVLSYGVDSKLCKAAWLELTMKNPESFINDEIAMQLLFPHFEHVRVLNDKFNFSPLFSNPRNDVAIVHHHGRKHLRPEALKIWWPCFTAAYRENFAKIRQWCPAGDNRLAEYLQANPRSLDRKED